MSASINNTRLGLTLNRIAKDIVQLLHFSGCMVAVLEKDGALPVRAFYVDAKLASLEQINSWEKRISLTIKKKISISDPEIARVYINDTQYQENLSYQAFHQKKTVISNDLFSLFTPIVPSNRLTKPIVNHIIQPVLKLKQVVAIPFFLDSPNAKEPIIVGNLFAAKSTKITSSDIDLLISYGKHAASAIEIEHHRSQVFQVAKHLTTEIQTNIRKEADMLQQIVEGVVNVLGYVGAMVATYNNEDDSLPVQAFHVDPTLATKAQIITWEENLSRILRKKISITDPEVAKVYINKSEYAENLSVQAVKDVTHKVSNEIGSLFTPIVPINMLTKPVISLIQKALKISQVIAIPFFLRAPDGNDPQIVGNLFVATVNPVGFQNEEIELLQAFGQQAAAGIFNAQLYREIDEQRQVAQVFATMAFSASKSIHQFRNDIGFVRGQLQLLPYIEQSTPKQREAIISATPKVIERIDDMSARLNQLHEPWRPVKPKPTNINTCIVNARDKVIPEHTSTIQVIFKLDKSVPIIITSSDMLTEVFRILIKNAVEAISDTSVKNGKLIISSMVLKKPYILVRIEDNGTGIKENNIKNIFKMGWSTKESGLGFGLFWTKDFLERSGGNIEVVSQWGHGTAFNVFIPKQPTKMDTIISQS